MKYKIIITWSEEDQAYVALVPELRGCVSHGNTVVEAAENIRDAASEWIYSAEKHGDPIPEPQGLRYNLEQIQGGRAPRP